MTIEYCSKCKQQITPKEWQDVDRPYYGIGICGCAYDETLPVLLEDDIIVDRNYDIDFAEIMTYGYRPDNIMTIW